MNILAMDTSNQAMGVAVSKDGQPLGELSTNIKKNHSVRLMLAIDHLMREVNMAPTDLDKIVAAKGPGSYTGVRIGLMTAKSMAWSLDIPITGVSSLEVLAWQGRFYHSYICPFFDARRGLVYTGLYRWTQGKLEAAATERNTVMEDWLRELAAMNQSVLFLSPDIQLHQENIRQQMGHKAIIPAAGTSHLASPVHLALAGQQKPADDTHTLSPNYLRLAEAEAKWLQKQKDDRENG
ncbi:tRNA (adenosine(37)-N6)-threonylcarbamoyltransferase complex dimerization subunit type 1 TsaB [Lentibacillus juripiscarius]|uniref:tRNA (Adenosine(37)-N6)-threonylcarbamoyltransferase complex dimerization subunit type 1 TsaB n=1 Tax=Lentibacillus juripiscarius TaxID=257446 RepID=A0ABW5V4C2_9BACI